MEPYLWLFLKMFPWILVSGVVGLLIGWAVRGGNVASRTDRLQAEAAQAKADCLKAEEQKKKLRDKNQKQEKRLQQMDKATAPREELEAAHSRLAEAEAEAATIGRERNAARAELEGFRESAVSGAEHSELRRLLEKQEREIRKAKAETERSVRELKAIQAREVHDLVGFEDDRDDRIKTLTLENTRLREILVKVQAGDGKSVLQLADEARMGIAAAGAAAAAAGADPAALAELREENVRLSGELETAKKKLLQAKAGGVVDAGAGNSLALERERDALKVALARTRAGGGSQVDPGQRAEISALKKERDRLVLELAEAKAGVQAPAEDKPADPPGQEAGAGEAAEQVNS